MGIARNEHRTHARWKSRWALPTFVSWGERDRIIPFTDWRAREVKWETLDCGGKGFAVSYDI